MTFTEGIEKFDPRDWERVDAMVSLGCAAKQDVTQLGDALSAAVRDAICGARPRLAPVNT